MNSRRIHRFLDAVERCGSRRVLGLPLRMIICCDWHRIHLWIIGIGVATFFLGRATDYGGLAVAGVLLACPSLVCLALLPPVVLSLVLLERVSGYRRDQQ